MFARSTYLLLALYTLLLSKTNGDSSRIHPDVQTILDQGEKVNVVVLFTKGIQPFLDEVRSQEITDLNERNQAIYDILNKNRDEQQAGVLQILSKLKQIDSEGFDFHKSYWISNKMFIKSANADTVKAVAEDPNVRIIINQVNGKRADNNMHVVAPRPNATDHTELGLWGIREMQVEEAWQELGGKRGEGVIVANIDTGVRHTHQLIRDQFVGTDYGWYDAMYGKQEPSDSFSGTFSMGNMVGNGGFGVAPDAKWMACRAGSVSTPIPGVVDSFFPGEAIIQCMQWIACPTLQDNTNPDCTRAPHIVTNGWITDRGSDFFNEEILVWRAMGIIPVFPVGDNEGSMCNAVPAPAELPFVIGVGISKENGSTYYLSSVGLASDGAVKPDLVAPGYRIASSSYGSDTAIYEETGSFATASYVAGVIALLKTRDLDLTYDQAYNFLTQNTNPLYLDPRNWRGEEVYTYCNESLADQVPNIFFGYGEVNAFKAVQAHTKAMSRKKRCVHKQ